MRPTIIITAANGFIGQSLVQHLKDNYRIVALVRTSLPSTPDVTYYVWDGRTAGEWKHELEGAFAVINLAGKSVNCRYNDINKAAIYSSRLESTHVIGKAIEACIVKPKVWMNAASATIYAHSLDRPNTEANGVIGTGFSVDVCQQWEAAFNAYNHFGVRQIALRTAIVLGKKGGVMTPFKRLAYLGMGGKMGPGNQQFSWIHELDVCRAIEHLLLNEASSGAYNIASPNPVRNIVFAATLRKKLRVPFGIPQPKWLLEFGARLIKTETELILKSRYVIPERLLQEGFVFQFPEIEGCLEDIV
ncbi:MAG: TIGR01777 family protein [Candidatus Fluviicola riflensis]|nr:MAG: TIGR01777 family protein [Candidatus Fluviicola riflensis]OGS79211.1 MAG: TIGR01777 family protein [Candidatus Fluviicola riflensis]OGS86643.1 MAG: TIGR01777 family protein [Fluviicola sp. RIFCSPHIGHO2_01_FULL_43_53]OGS88883.1 MAG: TIGR01777 family protein [Fluviicola sp. RIFCSPHIGHO2_12_FULL_43_24]